MILLNLSALKLEIAGALGNAENADGVGATALCPPALKSDNDIALLDNAEGKSLSKTVLDTVVDVLLPLGVVLRTRVRVEEGVAATVQVNVAGSVWIAGDGKDRAAWAVLADETGGGTASRHEQDGTSALLERGGNGSHGDGLVGIGGDGSEGSHLVEEGNVRNALLGKVCGLSHHLDSLNGVGTFGGLSGKHDTVSTVKNGIGNVGNLGTGGSVVDDHRLEHLSSADHRLAGNVALGDHHLLSHEDLRSGDLDTKVATSNHDTIGLLQDLVKVLDTLVVLDLGDNLDVGTLLAEDLTDGADIGTASDERGEDHVELLLDGELNVLLVLLRDGREVDLGHGKVDTLLGREDTVVNGADLDELLALDGEDLEGKDTVVDEDGSANFDLVGKVLVVDVEVLETALLSVSIVGGDVELVAHVDLDIFTVDHDTGSHLGALGIKSDGKGTTRGLSNNGASVVDDRLKVLMRTVRSIETDNVHTGLTESTEHLDIVGLGADGSDDRSI